MLVDDADDVSLINTTTSLFASRNTKSASSPVYQCDGIVNMTCASDGGLALTTSLYHIPLSFVNQ